jgi:hypothetical protein
MPTTTPNYALVKPDINGSRDTWGQDHNSNYDAIDGLLHDRIAKTSGGTQTMTQPLILEGQNGQPAGAAVTVGELEERLLVYYEAALVEADRIARALVNAVLPIGSVMLWSGGFGGYPTGWVPCTGGSAGGYAVPNYADRFILSAGPNNAPGTTGSFGVPGTAQPYAAVILLFKYANL